MISVAAGNTSAGQGRPDGSPYPFHREHQNSHHASRENGSHVSGSSPLSFNRSASDVRKSHCDEFDSLCGNNSADDLPRKNESAKFKRNKSPYERKFSSKIGQQQFASCDEVESYNAINETDNNESPKQLRAGRTAVRCCCGAQSFFQKVGKKDENDNKSNDVSNTSRDSSSFSCVECHHHVFINVSGQIFETQLKTLQRFPDTLLGHPEKRKKFYDPIRNQYYFDRNRPSFGGILHFYQSGGKIRRPLDVPVDTFADEIKFFRLGTTAMTTYQENEGYIFDDKEYIAYGDGHLPEKSEKKENLPKNDFQRKVWDLFEKPESSAWARLVAVISISVIFLSIICFCLETVPELQHKNSSITANMGNFSNSTTANGLYEFVKNPFWIIETICIGWFTIELTCRFLSSPNKARFWLDILNIIDLIAIVPYFVTTGSQLAAYMKGTEKSKGEKEISLAFIRVVRLVRVFRIFKLSRHSTGLQILGKTLKSSFQELGLLLFFVLIGVVIFSSAVYFAEFDGVGAQSHFKSIPDAFWWAIVTMTTVGYGDMHPNTLAGKLVGSVCALCGILCLALPVPVIVSNFMYFYQRARANKKRQHDST